MFTKTVNHETFKLLVHSYKIYVMCHEYLQDLINAGAHGAHAPMLEVFWVLIFLSKQFKINVKLKLINYMKFFRIYHALYNKKPFSEY